MIRKREFLNWILTKSAVVRGQWWIVPRAGSAGGLRSSSVFVSWFSIADDIGYSDKYFSISALTLLVERQEGRPTCKKLGVGLLVVTTWLELCNCTAPVITTTSIILSINRIQNGDILVPSYPRVVLENSVKQACMYVCYWDKNSDTDRWCVCADDELEEVDVVSVSSCAWSDDVLVPQPGSAARRQVLVLPAAESMSAQVAAMHNYSNPRRRPTPPAPRSTVTVTSSCPARYLPLPVCNLTLLDNDSPSTPRSFDCLSMVIKFPVTYLYTYIRLNSTTVQQATPR